MKPKLHHRNGAARDFERPDLVHRSCTFCTFDRPKPLPHATKAGYLDLRRENFHHWCEKHGFQPNDGELMDCYCDDFQWH